MRDLVPLFWAAEPPQEDTTLTRWLCVRARACVCVCTKLHVWRGGVWGMGACRVIRDSTGDCHVKDRYHFYPQWGFTSSSSSSRSSSPCLFCRSSSLQTGLAAGEPNNRHPLRPEQSGGVCVWNLLLIPKQRAGNRQATRRW